jgi:hypothetical protein
MKHRTILKETDMNEIGLKITVVLSYFRSSSVIVLPVYLKQMAYEFKIQIKKLFSIGFWEYCNKIETYN